MSDQSRLQIHLLLPVGTQVVSRVEIKSPTGELLAPRGAVGEITEAPDDGTHSYRVRFTGGAEAALQRHELTIRKQFQRTAIGPGPDALEEVDLYNFAIYRCVVGTRAFGLEGGEADTDRRGVVDPKNWGPLQRHRYCQRFDVRNRRLQAKSQPREDNNLSIPETLSNNAAVKD